MKTMQSRYIIYFCLLTLPCITTAQEDQTLVAPDTVEVIDNAYKLFSDIQLSHNWDGLRLSFDTISENQFNSFKDLYSPTIDTSTIAVGECPFQLEAADKVFIFKCPVGNFHGYQGYYPTLDSYLIIASSNEDGTAFLIERSTAKGVDIGGSHLAISPNNNQMIIYESGVYTDESHMSLVDISELKQLSDLNSKTSKTFYSDNWGIDQLVWIDNHHIALKITQNLNQPRRPLKVKYLKVKI